jgi:hypothetical protein
MGAAPLPSIAVPVGDEAAPAAPDPGTSGVFAGSPVAPKASLPAAGAPHGGDSVDSSEQALETSDTPETNKNARTNMLTWTSTD